MQTPQSMTAQQLLDNIRLCEETHEVLDRMGDHRQALVMLDRCDELLSELRARMAPTTTTLH
jgi:hypothetical protein